MYLSILFFLALSQRPQVGCLPYFDTWCDPRAYLECRSVWKALHAARCKCRTQKKSPKIAIWAPSHNFVGYIFATKACIDNRKKNLLSSNISSTCPHNMVNSRPTSGWDLLLVWGTPGNFNGFRFLAALLHGTLVVGVSQTAALNRGRHLDSAGRPSSWALAHISSVFSFAVNGLVDWLTDCVS